MNPVYPAAGALIATCLGAFAGLTAKKVPEKIINLMVSFAAGMMLSAAAGELIIPAGESSGYVAAAVGTALGALFLLICDVSFAGSAAAPGAALIALAMTMHNLPEGLAAGVSFATGDPETALSVTAGILLQDIPDGMVLIPPLLAAGMRPGRAMAVSALTGLVETAGVLIGYFWGVAARGILPVMMAFAGGAMLYVVCGELIPLSCGDKQGRLAVMFLAAGFCAMLLLG